MIRQAVKKVLTFGASIVWANLLAESRAACIEILKETIELYSGANENLEAARLANNRTIETERKLNQVLRDRISLLQAKVKELEQNVA